MNLEEHVMIYADESMLEIVWNNLLSNAIKYCEPRGSVSICQISDPQTVSVTIHDDRCGMDAQIQSHVFDKFYQGDTAHADEGNGLGLVLALRVVELAGGTITVQSQPGEGSSFTVVLPR